MFLLWWIALAQGAGLWHRWWVGWTYPEVTMGADYFNCARCDRRQPGWRTQRDDTTELRYCPDCWPNRHAPLPVPDALRDRLSFYRWLYRSGRISEYFYSEVAWP